MQHALLDLVQVDWNLKLLTIIVVMNIDNVTFLVKKLI